jgi:hypothetical protein
MRQSQQRKRRQPCRRLSFHLRNHRLAIQLRNVKASRNARTVAFVNLTDRLRHDAAFCTNKCSVVYRYRTCSTYPGITLERY